MHAEKTVIFQTSRLLSDKEYKTILEETLAHTIIGTRLSEHTIEPYYQNTYTLSATVTSRQLNGQVL